MSAPEPVQMVDATGRPCPIPIIELAKAVEKIAPGEVVELHSDDPASAVDVPVWCRMRRQRLLERRQDGRTWTFLVERVR